MNTTYGDLVRAFVKLKFGAIQPGVNSDQLNMNLYTLLTSFAEDIKLSLTKFTHLIAATTGLQAPEAKPIKQHQKSPSVFSQKVDASVFDE